MEVVCILDRSGSMSDLTNDTIGGFNDYIKSLKKLDEDVKLSLVLFDDKYDLVYDGVAIEKVKKLDDKTYFARGSTALLDAVGKAINTVGERLAKTAEDERPGKVIFFVTTDGQENASVEFAGNKIKEMVEHQKGKYNWDFIFAGANIDSFATGASVGFSHNFTANYVATPKGTSDLFATAALYTTNLCRSVSSGVAYTEELQDVYNKVSNESKA